MKFRIVSFFLILLSYSACRNTAAFHIVEQPKPAFYPNTIFKSEERLSSPGFAKLVTAYRLDTIFHGETDEFRRILLLRNWVKQRIAIDNIGPYPGDGSVESILDEAAKGHGFHCGHYMVVQNAVMNAFGYVTRCLGAGPGVQGGPDGHHGINEIWLNSHGKWFMSDAKYNLHFEKNGIPLSALEIRDEYLRNKAADVTIVTGTDKQPITPEETMKSKEANAQTYTWIEWNRDNDKYTNWPVDSSMMIIYNDDFSKKNKWIWDGKPHWAYNTPHMNAVENRHAIEWTPNTIFSTVVIKADTAVIELKSDTPNLKDYQLKKDDADWIAIPASSRLKLNKGRNQFMFRIINQAGITGPEHKIVISDE